MSGVIVAAAAALGASLSAALLFSDLRLISNAIAGHASGYNAVFARAYSIFDAFLCAVRISHIDIGIVFLSILIPYTTLPRPLTVVCAFMRAALFVQTVPAVFRAPSALVSLLFGVVSTLCILYRVDTVSRCRTEGASPRMPLRDTCSVIIWAVVISGTLISCRTLLLLFCSLFYR